MKWFYRIASVVVITIHALLITSFVLIACHQTKLNVRSVSPTTAPAAIKQTAEEIKSTAEKGKASTPVENQTVLFPFWDNIITNALGIGKQAADLQNVVSQYQTELTRDAIIQQKDKQIKESSEQIQKAQTERDVAKKLYDESILGGVGKAYITWGLIAVGVLVIGFIVAVVINKVILK